jgi:hypothetical protein
MARDKATNPNIDNSDPTNFPNARLKDNTGGNNGTPVNEAIYGDIQEFFGKLMRDAGIAYNTLPDSVATGYQLVQALIAMANKNNYVYELTSVSGVLQIATKIEILKEGEVLLCKAGFNKAAETTIKGSGTLVLTATISSAFKNGDYLQLQRTSGGVTLTRLINADNLNVAVGEKNYLKAATDLEEITGTSTTKATTPASNLVAFEDRVNGDSSDTFLATTGQNGLLSKEDKAIIDSFVDPVKNRGWFSGVDPGIGTVGSGYAHSGDVTSAIIDSVTGPPGASTILVTMANTMPNINYFVRLMVESEGTIDFDNDCLLPVFKKISTTQFKVSIQETYATTQSLKIHIEVVAI